jgi:hypothetical protein
MQILVYSVNIKYLFLFFCRKNVTLYENIVQIWTEESSKTNRQTYGRSQEKWYINPEIDGRFQEKGYINP